MAQNTSDIVLQGKHDSNRASGLLRDDYYKEDYKVDVTLELTTGVIVAILAEKWNWMPSNRLALEQGLVKSLTSKIEAENDLDNNAISERLKSNERQAVRESNRLHDEEEVDLILKEDEDRGLLSDSYNSSCDKAQVKLKLNAGTIVEILNFKWLWSDDNLSALEHGLIESLAVKRSKESKEDVIPEIDPLIGLEELAKKLE
jgi:hypothetical protein